MVALTGIEPAGCQSNSVHLGLSGCVFSLVRMPGCSGTPPRTSDITAQSQRDRGPSGADKGRTGIGAWRSRISVCETLCDQVKSLGWAAGSVPMASFHDRLPVMPLPIATIAMNLAAVGVRILGG